MQKQQHYIPKCYSKYFANNDGYVYLRDMWQNSCFPIKPINALKQGYIYTQPVHAEQRFDNAIENFFSMGVESTWPSVVEAIKSKKPLDNDLWGQLIQFMLSMRVRVPNTIKAVLFVLRAYAISVADQLPLSDSLKTLFKTLKPSFDGEPTFADLVSERIVSVPIDPHRALISFEKLIRSNHAVLSIWGNPKFLHNLTKVDFISSDNPFISHIYRRNIREIVPYSYSDQEDIEIIFPITSRILLLLNTRKSNDTQHYPVKNEDTIHGLNEKISLYSDRYIFGRNRDQLLTTADFSTTAPVPRQKRAIIKNGVVYDMEFTFGDPLRERAKWRYDFET